MPRLWLASAFALLVCPAWPSSYVVTPGSTDAKVTLTVETPSTVFRMPSWLPGDYQSFNYGRFVSGLEFKNGERTVAATHDGGPDTWSIPEGATSVSYTVKPSSGNFSPNLRVQGPEVFLGGGVWGSFDDHRQEPADVVVAGRGFSALRSTRDGFAAKDYDQLLDSPIVLSPTAKVAEKILHGKVHRVVAFGRNQDADPEAFLEVGLKVADQAFALFGELPYERYTFFLDFGGFTAGLEHSDCCRIGVSTRAQPRYAVGILFHEYFHCFNVKRLRARALGPFDYTRPAVTGTLWWLEGVTDYYADKLAARAGYSDRSAFLANMSAVANAVTDQAYSRHSADEASRRVWETRGSWGFDGVNYYTKGKAIGLFLDLAILAESGGKRSLDDVARRLYAETKPPKPGYADSRLRAVCAEVGGEQVGRWYDLAVSTAAPLPWAEVCDKAGLVWEGGFLKEAATDPSRPSPIAHWP